MLRMVIRNLLIICSGCVIIYVKYINYSATPGYIYYVRLDSRIRGGGRGLGVVHVCGSSSPFEKILDPNNVGSI